MRQALICEPVRTPIGRYGGMLKSQTAIDLGVAALQGLLERTGLAPESVEDVILGHCYPNSEAPADRTGRGTRRRPARHRSRYAGRP